LAVHANLTICTHKEGRGDQRQQRSWVTLMQLGVVSFGLYRLRNASSIRTYRLQGIRPVRSHSPHVAGSMPSCAAASVIFQPIARRLARIRSESVTGAGYGSYPRN